MQECAGLSAEAKAAGIRDVVSKSAGADKLLNSLKALLAA
jgi:ribosomal protein S5